METRDESDETDHLHRATQQLHVQPHQIIRRRECAGRLGLLAAGRTVPDLLIHMNGKAFLCDVAVTDTLADTLADYRPTPNSADRAVFFAIQIGR